MKIAIFLRDLGLGGVERCAVLVGEALAARGFSVTLVLLGGNRNLWASRIKQVQVVDLSNVWQPLKPWTWLAGWRAARRIAAEHDVVIAGTFLLPLYMAYAATRGLKKRVIGWVHGPFFELDQFAKMNPIHRAACQFVYRRLNELIFVSNHAKDSMARWLGQATPRRSGHEPQVLSDSGMVRSDNATLIRSTNNASFGRGFEACSKHRFVLPNFVDAAQAIPATMPRAENAPLRMVFIGRIAIEKQPQLWLDTLAALNAQNIAAHLTIVGDGPLEDCLKQEIQQRGLSEQITLAGRQENVSDYLSQADVLLLTSSFEGCPLVVLEAMPIGVLPASTNAGGVYELFAERRAEFVVNEASGAALANLIIKQQSHAAELSEWLKHRAEHYSQAVLIERWVRLLHQETCGRE